MKLNLDHSVDREALKEWLLSSIKEVLKLHKKDIEEIK